MCLVIHTSPSCTAPCDENQHTVARPSPRHQPSCRARHTPPSRVTGRAPLKESFCWSLHPALMRMGHVRTFVELASYCTCLCFCWVAIVGGLHIADTRLLSLLSTRKPLSFQASRQTVIRCCEPWALHAIAPTHQTIHARQGRGFHGVHQAALPLSLPVGCSLVVGRLASPAAVTCLISVRHLPKSGNQAALPTSR